MRHLLWAALLAVGASSCQGDSRTLTHHYQSLPNDVWSQTDTLRFAMPASEQGTYLLSVGLLLGNSYHYNDIWLVAETRLTDPQHVRRDTIHVATSASDTHGAKGVNLRQCVQQASSLPLEQGQRGEILVYHIMTTEDLPHVAGVGVRVERR